MLLLVMCTTNTAARNKTTKPLADGLVVTTEANSDSCLIILEISENTRTSYLLRPTPYRTDMALIKLNQNLLDFLHITTFLML